MAGGDEARRETAPFRRVLVGLDGSPDSTEALSVATQIAGRDGGHVVALAVLSEGTAPEAGDDGDCCQATGRQAVERTGERQYAFSC